MGEAQYFHVHRCARCNVLIIRYRGKWYPYPTELGDITMGRPYVRTLIYCYRKWGLIPRPHRLEEVGIVGE